MVSMFSGIIGSMINAVGTSKMVVWWFINLPFRTAIRVLRFSFTAWLNAYLRRNLYPKMSKVDLLSVKASKRVFVFGSGYSLNDVSDEEWRNINKYDSIGFNGSYHLQKVNFTFLIHRAGYETVDGLFEWESFAKQTLSEINQNSYLNGTVFLFPTGLTQSYVNNIVGSRFWDPAKPIFHYYTDRFSKNPHRDIGFGLVQAQGTLCTAISFAVSMGYEEIVLIGVDLYDNRYFWIQDGKTVNWCSVQKKEIASDVNARDLCATDLHNTVNNGVIQTIEKWDRYFSSIGGPKVTVYNEKSLLAKSIKVFRWS